jgi:hypothetical protein
MRSKFGGSGPMGGSSMGVCPAASAAPGLGVNRESLALLAPALVRAAELERPPSARGPDRSAMERPRTLTEGT